jgi:hypothetical protein
VKNRFQSLPFKRNPQRYTAAAAAIRAAINAEPLGTPSILTRLLEVGLYNLNSVYP